MPERYSVTHNAHGYEGDPATHRLQWAVTDNKPDRMSIYKPTERARVLVASVNAAPFRHVAYCETAEDAALVAGALNDRGVHFVEDTGR